MPVLALFLIACSDPGTSKDSGATGDTDAETTAPTGGELPEPTVETFTTRDGVDLVGDVYAGDPGAPGVVLLHMIPPAWDRASWPADFVSRLRSHGWWVVALDRRGAGDSGGAAVDAYEGEKGRYDLEAAALWLRDAGAGDLAVIGASNGTTTLLDYAIWAPGEGLPPVTVAGLMTGGTYTENNDDFDAMPDVPAIFTFSTAERAWSVEQQAGGPAAWEFVEYPTGDHGTLMFDAAPQVAADIDAFLAESLGGS